MIREYNPADLSRIEMSPGHQELAARPEVVDALGVLSTGRLVKTSLAGEAVVAIMGLIVDGEGCEVFIFPSRWAAHNAFTLFRDVLSQLKRAREMFPVVRALTRDTDKANRFLVHLGFKREGFRGEMLVWVYR